MTKLTLAQIINQAKSFKPTVYQYQDELFYSKQVKFSQVSKWLGSYGARESDKVIVEICPNGKLQIVNCDAYNHIIFSIDDDYETVIEILESVGFN